MAAGPGSERPAGRIILLNGASSSGKSSIALELRARLDRPFWHISVDHLFEAGVLPFDRIRRGDFDWPEMREAFFEGFERSLAAYAEAGNDLVAEYIVETPAWMRRLVGTLAGLDTFFVGVRCGLAELERRERARGDRRLGDARRDFFTVHEHADYDLEVDSSLPPGINADRIVAAWRSRPGVGAFARMAARPWPVGS